MNYTPLPREYRRILALGKPAIMPDKTLDALEMALTEAEAQYAADKEVADASLMYRDRMRDARDNYIAALSVQRPFRLSGAVLPALVQKPQEPVSDAMPVGRFDQIEWVIKSYGHGVQAAQIIAVLYKRRVFGEDKDKEAVSQMVHRNIFSMKKNGRLVEYPDTVKRKSFYGLRSFFNADGTVKPEHALPQTSPKTATPPEGGATISDGPVGAGS